MKKLMKNKLFFAGAILLACLLQFISLFTTFNWGKYYWQHETWAEIASDPASYKKATVVFFTVMIILLGIGLFDHMKNNKGN